MGKVVDLHGHGAQAAIHEVATPLIEAAWRRGLDKIMLIHGSPDVETYQASKSGHGSIKWGLRSALRRGDWERWVWGIRSKKHSGLQPNSGSMTLALRPNPSPDPEFPWPETPEPAHDYEGPWHRRYSR